jgi:hypothetical protein
MKLSCSLSVLVALTGATNSAVAFQNVRPPASTSTFKTTALFVNSNVIMKPSEDASAFDSLKIGGARVHRYSRESSILDTDLDSETEYVMWYHARSIEQDADKSLPPLSTGRIGRATSKNGLLWKKDTVGSLSEDVDDCSLGINKESWWGFDTAHVGLGNVLLPMTTPAVMTEGGVFLMYYMGGNFDETPIGDYTEKEMPADAKIKGMKMKVGVCISQDGITWGRVEGDDPSGACMVPYDKADPNLQEMALLRDDDNSEINLKEELYCGWPEVVVDIKEADQGKSGFFMYYSTMTKLDKQKSIACAVSSDGFRWDKRGLCLEPTEGSMDADGCARCTVIRNAAYNDETATWKDIDGYTMYYEGVSKEDGKHRIMMAQGMDGRKWTKQGVVVDVGESDDAFDCEGVGFPNVLR